jgi:hypothetical protein
MKYVDRQVPLYYAFFCALCAKKFYNLSCTSLFDTMMHVFINHITCFRFIICWFPNKIFVRLKFPATVVVLQIHTLFHSKKTEPPFKLYSTATQRWPSPYTDKQKFRTLAVWTAWQSDGFHKPHASFCPSCGVTNTYFSTWRLCLHLNDILLWPTGASRGTEIDYQKTHQWPLMVASVLNHLAKPYTQK